jgi:hypothetical protein
MAKEAVPSIYSVHWCEQTKSEGHSHERLRELGKELGGLDGIEITAEFA